MTLQEKSLATIELPKILEMLAAEAATPPAKELCRQLRPETSLTQCEKLQEETEDASRLIGLQGSPAFSGVKDISNALERAEKGGFLNPVELLAVGALLRAARLTKAYREERRDTQQTSLDGYFTMLTGNKFLEEKIENAIVSEEEISALRAFAAAGGRIVADVEPAVMNENLAWRDKGALADLWGKFLHKMHQM